MPIDKSWRERLLHFLGIAPAGPSDAVGVLRRQYIWESQHAARNRRYAEKMQYPQFREALLRIAAEESKHLEWIAEMLRLLGSEPPGVPPIAAAEMNSWQYLSEDLEEGRQHDGELFEQAVRMSDEAPAAAQLLVRIYENGKKHRDEIRRMVMKSDPQSLWPP